MLNRLEEIVSGKTFETWKTCGLLVSLVKPIYSVQLKINTLITAQRLKENMITSSDPTTAIIIRAKSET
ncbi:hypothetical protein [Antarcticibacterium sp. 1MA-6-2]|uniref:hypothetical protein n=1 Tax=Antarcticibacterium sp. 1MA-6-2 TaxID=2908210 RepID=UPI0028834F38|nr:hypothetical protein [Antarcticibacterium sp. 1MA-6-2]